MELETELENDQTSCQKISGDHSLHMNCECDVSVWYECECICSLQKLILPTFYSASVLITLSCLRVWGRISNNYIKKTNIYNNYQTLLVPHNKRSRASFTVSFQCKQRYREKSIEDEEKRAISTVTAVSVDQNTRQPYGNFLCEKKQETLSSLGKVCFFLLLLRLLFWLYPPVPTVNANESSSLSLWTLKTIPGSVRNKCTARGREKENHSAWSKNDQNPLNTTEERVQSGNCS